MQTLYSGPAAAAEAEATGTEAGAGRARLEALQATAPTHLFSRGPPKASLAQAEA